MGICDGRVVVITGAGRGIGREEALLFAAEGAKVVVNDYGVSVDGSAPTSEVAEAVVEEIKAMGGEAVANADDVADWEGAQRLLNTAIETFGGLDTLVNNAGILRDRMIFNMTEEEWDAVIRVHLKGTFCTTRWATAYWRERVKAGETNDARIINTSSGSGLYANPGQANYGAAKSGIASMTQIVAKEVARFGVTANAIAPGARTRMTENLPGRPPQAELKPGEFDRRDPANVAPLVVWLGSNESADVTGEVFNVGGSTISRATTWGRGEPADKGDRWDPKELGPVVRGLIGGSA
ncbi:MAG TPA: SDR family oxidoreductase [Acidimicrobiales bacterium]|jgi:NAD(P)-dependent dehydrogenase (short-subunit alcohol dehydrogenase family)|nr:SDR family oxidoreductase [Acidimicrobiales bacterium]